MECWAIVCGIHSIKNPCFRATHVLLATRGSVAHESRLLLKLCIMFDILLDILTKIVFLKRATLAGKGICIGSLVCKKSASVHGCKFFRPGKCWRSFVCAIVRLLRCRGEISSSVSGLPRGRINALINKSSYLHQTSTYCFLLNEDVVLREESFSKIV